MAIVFPDTKFVLVVWLANPAKPIIPLAVEFCRLFAVVRLPMILFETVNWVVGSMPDDWNDIPLRLTVPVPPHVIPPIKLPEIFIAPCPLVVLPARIPQKIALVPEQL